MISCWLLFMHNPHSYYFIQFCLLLAHKICCWVLFVVFLKPANEGPANTVLQWGGGGGVLLTGGAASWRGNGTQGQTRFIHKIWIKRFNDIKIQPKFKGDRNNYWTKLTSDYRESFSLSIDFINESPRSSNLSVLQDL